MNRMYKLVAAAACALSVAAYADQVTLKNGDRITGKIVTADEKTVLVKTDYAGDVKIDRASITGIQTDQVLNADIKDSGTVQGKVASAAEGVRVEKADGTALTVKADAITALRDDAAQKAYIREQERIHHPKLNDFWAGFVSLGVANASGNASTSTVSTAASATRIAGKNKMGVNFTQIYARQSTTLPYGETANRMNGAFRIDRDIAPRLFVYGINTYDYDKFLDLNLRVVLGGGFGYHAWKSKKGYLDVLGGGNVNRETFDITNVVKTGKYTTDTRTSGELAVSEEAGYQPYERLKLFERFSFFPNMSDTGEYRYNFDATASVPIKKWFEFNVGFSSRYLSNPIAGKKNNDTILTMGIRASFDQAKR
jgi:putative salt-induced outer membrane protein YdiY